MPWQQLKHKVFLTYFGLAAAYIAVTFLSPIPEETIQQYHLTVTSLRLIDLAIVVPLVIIWGAAFYGYYYLNGYAQLIKRNSDGKALHKLSYGLLFLALWMPVSSIISGLLKDAANGHSGLTTAGIIVNDYSNLLLPLIGFWFIGVGARDLSNIAKQRPSRVAINIMALILISIGVVYSHLVTTTQNRLSEAYRLNIFMVLATLVIPYIFMWFIGMLATYEIYIYHQQIKGVFYGRSMRLVAYGMGSLLISSIFIQYLTTLSSRLSVLSLNGVLVVIYIFLIILACSYVLIAMGAKRLQKIEEV